MNRVYPISSLPRACLCLCLAGLVLLTQPAAAQGTDNKSQIYAAVATLLQESKKHFDEKQFEQAAAVLERALRIDPRNAVLWHNLAGVRLQQENWERALSLAARSNDMAVDKGIDNRWLRIRNWTVIALACEGMKDVECAREARSRAHILATQ